jgi:hypothetical protein
VVTLLLYAPWLPTLFSQVQHDGRAVGDAPGFPTRFCSRPERRSPSTSRSARSRRRSASGLARRRGEIAPFALLVVAATTILAAWTESQLSSTWTSRYFAVVFGPLLLAVGAGLVRSGRLGIAALAFAVVLWIGYSPHDEKSNARAVAHASARYPRAGDLVLTTHPEQDAGAALLPSARASATATQLGPVADPQVMDWRDALARIRAGHAHRPAAAPARDRAAGWALRRRLPGLPRLPRVAGAVDARGLRHLAGLDAGGSQPTPASGASATISSNEILGEKNYWKPLQAVDLRRRR